MAKLEIKGFLVVNIGCIECGVSSGVVGVYETEDEAQSIAAKCDHHLSWREGGQNSFEVFDLSADQDSDYSEAINHD